MGTLNVSFLRLLRRWDKYKEKLYTQTIRHNNTYSHNYLYAFDSLQHNFVLHFTNTFLWIIAEAEVISRKRLLGIMQWDQSKNLMVEK